MFRRATCAAGHRGYAMITSTVRLLKSAARRTGLTAWLRRSGLLQWLPVAAPQSTPSISQNAESPLSYESRLAAEQAHFASNDNVHDLPAIFHYWSNSYLRPKLELFGFSNPDQFFAAYLDKTFVPGDLRSRRYISVGAGNCDTEIRLAKQLVESGKDNFTIECVDINAEMLKRGAEMASREGVGAQIITRRLDLNDWHSHREYDAVIANQSLHHIVELEQLFDTVLAALREDGFFITSDMIGRNGHQRWPEALAIVHEFWRQLPERYHYNHQLKRIEHVMENWDCSGVGFEGIRSQDILKLLLERFEFDLFIGYANVIDPFIDRSFGHNFDANSPQDRAFIDRVHACDEEQIAAGNITPTHLIAAMRLGSPGTCHRHVGLPPARCVRHVA